jgi:hypothetical protein
LSKSFVARQGKYTSNHSCCGYNWESNTSYVSWHRNMEYFNHSVETYNSHCEDEDIYWVFLRCYDVILALNLWVALIDVIQKRTRSSSWVTIRCWESSSKQVCDERRSGVANIRCYKSYVVPLTIPSWNVQGGADAETKAYQLEISVEWWT